MRAFHHLNADSGDFRESQRVLETLRRADEELRRQREADEAVARAFREHMPIAADVPPLAAKREAKTKGAKAPKKPSPHYAANPLAPPPMPHEIDPLALKRANAPTQAVPPEWRVSSSQPRQDQAPKKGLFANWFGGDAARPENNQGLSWPRRGPQPPPPGTNHGRGTRRT